MFALYNINIRRNSCGDSMVSENNTKRAVRSPVVMMVALGLGVLSTGLVYDVYGMKSAEDYYQNMAEASVMAVLDTANDDTDSNAPSAHNIHLKTKGKHTFSTEILIDNDRNIEARVVGHFTSPLRTWFGTKWVGNGRVKIERVAMGKWPENYSQVWRDDAATLLRRPANLRGSP